jgi:hypothetical protein
MSKTIEDYTVNHLDETHGEGWFRTFPLARTVEESTKTDSQSVAIAFRLGIQHKWHGAEEGWSTDWPIGYFVDNRTYIIGKDGNPIEKNVQRLIDLGLWDGDFASLEQPCPGGFYLLAEVKAETFDGKVRVRADWLNADSSEPPARGGFTPASPDMLRNLRTKFGSKMRAAAGKSVTKGQASAQPQAAPAQPTPAVANTPAQPGAQAAPQTTLQAAPGFTPPNPSAPAASSQAAPQAAPGVAPAPGGPPTFDETPF